MVFETVQTQGRSSFGSARVSGLSGSLVSARVFTPHKHSGDASIKENSPGSLPSSRISLVCANRQYNSHRLHKQGRGIRSWLLMKVTILLQWRSAISRSFMSRNSDNSRWHLGPRGEISRYIIKFVIFDHIIAPDRQNSWFRVQSPPCWLLVSIGILDLHQPAIAGSCGM